MSLDKSTINAIRARAAEKPRTAHKLSPSQIESMLGMYASGESAYSVARAYGVNPATVRHHVKKALSAAGK